MDTNCPTTPANTNIDKVRNYPSLRPPALSTQPPTPAPLGWCKMNRITTLMDTNSVLSPLTTTPAPTTPSQSVWGKQQPDLHEDQLPPSMHPLPPFSLSRIESDEREFKYLTNLLLIRSVLILQPTPPPPPPPPQTHILTLFTQRYSYASHCQKTTLTHAALFYRTMKSAFAFAFFASNATYAPTTFHRPSAQWVFYEIAFYVKRIFKLKIIFKNTFRFYLESWLLRSVLICIRFVSPFIFARGKAFPSITNGDSYQRYCTQHMYIQF